MQMTLAALGWETICQRAGLSQFRTRNDWLRAVIGETFMLVCTLAPSVCVSLGNESNEIAENLKKTLGARVAEQVKSPWVSNHVELTKPLSPSQLQGMLLYKLKSEEAEWDSLWNTTSTLCVAYADIRTKFRRDLDSRIKEFDESSPSNGVDYHVADIVQELYMRETRTSRAVFLRSCSAKSLWRTAVWMCVSTKGWNNKGDDSKHAAPEGAAHQPDVTNPPASEDDSEDDSEEYDEDDFNIPMSKLHLRPMPSCRHPPGTRKKKKQTKKKKKKKKGPVVVTLLDATTELVNILDGEAGSMDNVVHAVQAMFRDTERQLKTTLENIRKQHRASIKPDIPTKLFAKLALGMVMDSRLRRGISLDLALIRWVESRVCEGFLRPTVEMPKKYRRYAEFQSSSFTKQANNNILAAQGLTCMLMEWFGCISDKQLRDDFIDLLIGKETLHGVVTLTELHELVSARCAVEVLCRFLDSGECSDDIIDLLLDVADFPRDGITDRPPVMSKWFLEQAVTRDWLPIQGRTSSWSEDRGKKMIRFLQFAAAAEGSLRHSRGVTDCSWRKERESLIRNLRLACDRGEFEWNQDQFDAAFLNFELLGFRHWILPSWCKFDGDMFWAWREGALPGKSFLQGYGFYRDWFEKTHIEGRNHRFGLEIVLCGIIAHELKLDGSLDATTSRTEVVVGLDRRDVLGLTPTATKTCSV